MTTATLRPNGNVVAPDSFTGAASAHAALSDDSDSSYITSQYALFELGTVSLPAGSVTKQIRERDRARADSGSISLDVDVTTGGTLLAHTARTSVGTTLTTRTGAYNPVTLTQAQVNALRIAVQEPSSSASYRAAELYVDLVYVTIPVTTVTAVSPDPYTASTTVPIAWSNTLDSDGGGQKRYEIKVFTDAQYGAGGFDPDTSTPYLTTGEIVSSNTTADVGPLENGDTYRAYVRVAQTVNGAAHWSDWAYDQFTMSVTTSEVDTVTAVATDASGLITVTVAWDNASTGWEYIEVQRSIDSGTTWTDVRGATYVATADSGATDFEVVDYEVPNGTSATYRARATWLSTGPVAGSWVESSAESWSSSDVWLKAPNAPSLNMTAGTTRLVARRSNRSGVFNVIGRQLPVVVSDVRSGFAGTLPIDTNNAAEHASLKALLDGSNVLLVQFPASFDIDDAYVAVIGDAEVFASEAPLQLARTWPLEVVEVDAPADPDASSSTDA